MPNWASGSVKIEGRPHDIEKFCKLFLFYGTEAPKKYFARSFIHMNWEDFKKEYLGQECAEFGVEFAWSATSCLIYGYPQDNLQTCPTLIEACKKHKVKVVIDTEEGGMAFEEHIECDEKGSLLEECSDMPIYKCKKCGSEQTITSCQNIEDEACYECEIEGQWESNQNGK